MINQVEYNANETLMKIFIENLKKEMTGIRNAKTSSEIYRHICEHGRTDIKEDKAHRWIRSTAKKMLSENIPLFGSNQKGYYFGTKDELRIYNEMAKRTDTLLRENEALKKEIATLKSKSKSKKTII